jgi:hypothetical protein
MKKRTIVMAMMAVGLMATGNVFAGMVDIGTGQMESSEFEALKAIVQGRPNHAAPVVSTVRTQVESYGMVDMTPAEFEALRNKVLGIEDDRKLFHTTSMDRQMVDIGTGAMPADEFAALKRMVQTSARKVSSGLAAMHP